MLIKHVKLLRVYMIINKKIRNLLSKGRKIRQ